MELLAIVALALFLSGRPSSDAPVTESSSSGAPPSDAGGGIDQVLGTGVKVLGGVMAAAGAVKGALAAGAGTAAAGTGTAAGGTATGGTVAVGGSSSTAGGSVGGAAAAGGGAASSIGLGGGIALGFVSFYLVLAIVAKFVNAASEKAKDFHSQLYWKLASAHALNQVESHLAPYLLPPGVTYSGRAVRDFRLDRYLQGSKVVFQGWRDVMTPLPMADAEERVRRLRGLALEFLRVRHNIAANIIERWLGNKAPGDFEFARTRQYEVEYSTPGLGGLNHVPSILYGRTLVYRRDELSVAPTVNELVGTQEPTLRYPIPLPAGVPYVEQPTGTRGIEPITPALEDALPMRLMGALDALSVVKWDPKLYVPWDAEWYAKDLLARAGLGPANGVTELGGGRIRFDASSWGINTVVDVTALKEGRAAVVAS